MQTQKRTRKLSGFAALLVGAMSLGLGLTTTASAANIQVTTLLDVSGAGCTLRDAITAANTDTGTNGCPAGSGADTITFNVSGTITLSDTLSVNSMITVDGSGQSITISGNNAVRVFSNDSASTLQLRNLTVANGSSSLAVGGIVNNGALSISNCTFSGNRAGPSASGGAIYNLAGTLTVNGSTFSGNTAGSDGGAIFLNGEGTISNSTFWSNSANGQGGAISNNGALTLINSTFSGNGATGTVGGGAVFNQGTLNLANTILANSTSGGDCVNFGTIKPLSPNLVMDGSCSISGALTGDPKLGPLADNGGPTLTMALLTGSPAIDAADDTICKAPPVNDLDQRGQPRSTDGKCDIGAYESPSATFTFTGFLSPVANPPTENSVKAGQGVPIKFSLGGNQGLNIFISGYPMSQPVSCSSGVPIDVITQTVTAGNSSLSYDPASNTYTYVWKTDTSWAGACRQFVMRLTDGSYHVAVFQFR